MPRPPKPYTEKTYLKILDLIVEGKTISDIARMQGYPTAKTIRKYFLEHEELFPAYMRARSMQGDYYADLILDLNRQLNNENWQHMRYQIDNLKWLAGKLNDRYSDKPAVSIDQSQHVHVDQTKVSQDDMSKRLTIAAQQLSMHRELNSSTRFNIPDSIVEVEKIPVEFSQTGGRGE